MRALFRLLFFSLFVTSAGCSNKDKATSDEAAITSQLLASTWGVHYFYINSIDKTALYTNCTFTFKKDSNLIVSSMSVNYNGKWFIQKQQDGSVKLGINGFSDALVQSFNNDWKISGNDGTLVILKDYLPASDKELHFIRQ
jgi:hypothetical protein